MAKPKQPKAVTNTRATFYIDRGVMAKLQAFVGRAKAQAAREGRPSTAPSMSQIVQAGIEAELVRRKKEIGT